MSVPDAFRERLAEWGELDVFDHDESFAPPERLAEVGVRALARSTEPEGRERRGAFDLLAADAFLTRAAAGALERDDAPELLARMASWIAAGGRGAFDDAAARPGAPDADATD